MSCGYGPPAAISSTNTENLAKLIGFFAWKTKKKTGTSVFPPTLGELIKSGFHSNNDNDGIVWFHVDMYSEIKNKK